MVAFPFRIGKAFLEYNSHPITIPKRHYAELEREGLAVGSVKIVSAYGTLPGSIVHSIAGFGPYYQIKMDCGHSKDCMTRFELGEYITVQLSRVEDRIQINLAK